MAEAQMNEKLKGFVELHRQDQVLEIRMVKAPVNAICRGMSAALYEAAMYLQRSDDLRVGLLTSGQSKAFSAGLDFNTAGESFESPTPGGFGGITQAWDFKKPLIAVINGPAIGGGLELALACDLIVMAEDAYLRLPELERGLLPDGGGLQRLPRRIPYHIATAMIWTGDPMSAADAKACGLVWRTAPRAELGQLALELAQKIAQSAPLAQQALKEVLRATDGMTEREAMALRADGRPGLETYTRMLRSKDMVEGQRAFLEKRRPCWQGE